MKCQFASREYVCDLCGQPIPAGDRYWRDFSDPSVEHPLGMDSKQHANCAEYEPRVTAQEAAQK